MAAASDHVTVVTASHVIAGSERFHIVFAAAPDVPPFVVTTASIAGIQMDPLHGLAAFRVHGPIPASVRAAVWEIETPVPVAGKERLDYWGYPNRALTPRRLSGYLSAVDGPLLILDRSAGEGASGGPLMRGDKVIGIVTASDEQFTYAVSAPAADVVLRGWDVVSESPRRISRAPDLIATLHRIAVINGACEGGDDISAGFSPVLSFTRSGLRREARPNISHSFRDLITLTLMVKDCRANATGHWGGEFSITSNEAGMGIVTRQLEVGGGLYELSYSVMPTESEPATLGTRITFPFQGKRVCLVDEDGKIDDCFDSVAACEKGDSDTMLLRELSQLTCRTAPPVAHCFEHEAETSGRIVSCHMKRAQCEANWNATTGVRTYCVEVGFAKAP